MSLSSNRMKPHEKFFRNLLGQTTSRVKARKQVSDSLRTPSNQALRGGSLPKFRATRRLTVNANLGVNKTDPKSECLKILQHDVDAYNFLLKTPKIAAFLRQDKCFMRADSTLLAVVFVYMKRADLHLYEFNEENFWLMLYIAHEFNEDEPKFKWDLLPRALGRKFLERRGTFNTEKLRLLKRMDFRGLVRKTEVNQVVSILRSEVVSSRVRREDHGGCWVEDDLCQEIKIPLDPNLPCPRCESAWENNIFCIEDHGLSPGGPELIRHFNPNIEQNVNLTEE